MGKESQPSQFDSDACMSRRIKHHMEHLGEHSGGSDQAIAIAASECGISKHSVLDHAKMGCFEAQISRFDATNGSVKINGAAYQAVDTGDGYHTVKNIPIFSEIPKGTHGAPYDVTKGELEKFLSVMQSRYSDGKRCGALSVGHNDDFGLTHPAFAGFFLPHKIGQYRFPDGKERWTLFADFKIPNDKFALFAAGKLHSHSPEIYPKSWDDRKIDIVSFLDTKPPYFDYAMNTVGEILRDSAAKFEATYEGKDMTLDELKKKLLDGELSEVLGPEDAGKLAAKFAAYSEAEKAKEKGGEKKAEDPEDKFSKDYPASHKFMTGIHEGVTKLMKHFNLKFDSMASRPDPMPIEPGTTSGGAKMSLDPEMAAKFASQENKLAELNAKFDAQESEKKAKTLVDKAESALSRKVVTSALRDQIAKFASDAVSKKDGEAWFDKFVESLKPSLRDKPPLTPAEFSAGSEVSIESTDPVLSKFASEGVDGLEQVSKFANQYRAIKAKMGDSFTCSEDSYIKNELSIWKASRNGQAFDHRR